jgi:hypothetical protein
MALPLAVGLRAVQLVSQREAACFSVQVAL